MGSRIHATGTVFSRVQGLLRSGVLKSEDKPIWYNVWKAFPPRDPPMARRPAPNTEVPEILYPEDLVRAKYYKRYKEMMEDLDLSSHREAINLCSEENSRSQRFIEDYITTHKAEGFVDFEDFYLQFIEKEQSSLTELYNSLAIKAHRTLYVSALPETITLQLLRKVFSQYGEVESIQIVIRDDKAKSSTIVFKDQASIDKVVEEKEIKVLDKVVSVKRYTEIEKSKAITIGDIEVMDQTTLKNYKHPTSEEMFGKFQTEDDVQDDLEEESDADNDDNINR